MKKYWKYITSFILIISLVYFVLPKATYAAVANADSGTRYAFNNTATTSLDLTFTVSAGATCLVAAIDVEGAVTNSAIHWDSAGTNQNMTSATVSSASGRVEIFYLTNPTIGTLTLHATWTTSRKPQMVARAYSGTATAGGSCINAADTKTGTATTNSATVTLTSTTNGATFAAASDSTQYFSSTNFTTLYANTTGNIGFGVNDTLGGTSNVHTMAVTSSTWGIAGIHIVAPATSPSQHSFVITNTSVTFIRNDMFTMQ